MFKKKEVSVWAFKDLPVRIIWLESDGTRIREDVLSFKEETIQVKICKSERGQFHFNED